jgi:hypothetical protein
MKRKKINNLYPLWVWLVTISTYPIAAFISVFFETKPGFRSFFKIFPYIVFYSVVYSLPVMVVYCLFFFRLIKTRLNPVQIKLVLIFIALTGVIVTLHWISIFNEYLVLFYAVPLVVAGFTFRIGSQKNLPIKKYDVFEARLDINPAVPKGTRGTVLEEWEGGVFEVEFLNADGQQIVYEGKKSFTINRSDIGHYKDPFLNFE